MGKKNDIRYNGSGYYDETAYKAIRNTDRGGTASMEYNKGEIWEIETTNGATREVFLVQCFDDYAAVLTLIDSQPNHTYMQIKSQDLRYMDCGRLVYVFYDKFVKFIRMVSDEELKEVQYRIASALDLPASEMSDTAKEQVAAMEAAAVPVMGVDTATQPQLQAETECELKQLLMDSALELEGMTRERDIYKELYNQLLGKLL